jgi:serine/threonine protein kinase
MTTAVNNPFVDALYRLPILEPVQMEKLPRIQRDFPLPRALAKELIRREWLSAYQANQILLGHADDLVIGSYLCLNKVGEGGMGQVFKARKRPLDRVVALKVLRRECVENARTLQRFLREMRAVGQLQHSNIIRASDADEANGVHYIAMEFIEGLDLARMVKRQGPLPVEQALEYMRQAALGLQHAHDSGLVHRDIKPANLLVAAATNRTVGDLERTRWGVVKILDLGLARLADPREENLTALGTVMGTPDFMAPEQARNASTCDNRADIYSLGCTLYYVLAGRIPFPRGSVAEKILQHQTDEPDAVLSVRRARMMQDAARTGKRVDDAALAIPFEVEVVLRKMMAKRPADRFKTPAELADAIESVLGGDPMSITQTPVLTNPNIALGPPPPMPQPTPLPAPLTMRMSDVVEPLSQSVPWRSIAKRAPSDAIVHVSVPKPRRRPKWRWWLVGAAAATIIAAILLVQGSRAVKSHAADALPVVKGEKES